MDTKIHLKIHHQPHSGLSILLTVAVLVALFLGFLFLQTQHTRAARLESDQNSNTDLMRKFYLTEEKSRGNGALTACTDGYHMASLWEILDPSNLKYDTSLGFTTDDSGLGPPAYNSTAWVRTGWGSEASFSEKTGRDNCNTWTSASASDYGSYVHFQDIWTNDTHMGPWFASRGTCVSQLRVYCIEDQVYHHQVFLPQVVRE